MIIILQHTLLQQFLDILKGLRHLFPDKFQCQYGIMAPLSCKTGS